MDDSTPNTLYEILGEKVISQLVDSFYARVYKHPVLIPLFQTDIEVVKDKQFCFLSQFLGGPPLYNQKYGQPRMRMRHLPHPINQQSMVAWLDCMKRAISSLDLSPELSEELYNRFPALARHMVNS